MRRIIFNSDLTEGHVLIGSNGGRSTIKSVTETTGTSGTHRIVAETEHGALVLDPEGLAVVLAFLEGDEAEQTLPAPIGSPEPISPAPCPSFAHVPRPPNAWPVGDEAPPIVLPEPQDKTPEDAEVVTPDEVIPPREQKPSTSTDLVLPARHSQGLVVPPFEMCLNPSCKERCSSCDAECGTGCPYFASGGADICDHPPSEDEPFHLLSL